MSNTFEWKTNFKSTIIVDNELFQNDYHVELTITPNVTDLKEQSSYFERLKNLFELVLSNTVTGWRGDTLYQTLLTKSNNRFIELPKPPYDQIMAAVCFCKANAVLDGKITVSKLKLGSYQGDGITYPVDKNSKELTLLDVDGWFSKKFKNFDPWWLRSDTATYDKELPKGLYTGHFSWNNQTIPVDKDHGDHAKIFEFNPKVLDGGKNKDK
jgi:hypothetical protein|tara:strand:+ start:3416 stop:4051 length:636 start_codon:yes stop_codon:yes gene_type:complete